MNNNRDIRFDLMKGIGILCMLVGHYSDNHILHQLIYSFHMPLFFVLGGYFTKVSAKNVCGDLWMREWGGG